jgi:hypothetical protein
MQNLFEQATLILQYKVLISDLNAINRSNIFPVLPINIQQKTERLLRETTQSLEEAKTVWPGEASALEDFLVFLGDTGIPDISFLHSTQSFINNTNDLIMKYSSKALRPVQTNLQSSRKST